MYLTKKTSMVVTGVGGMVGSTIFSRFNEHYDITGISRTASQSGVIACDITEPQSLLSILDEAMPQVIFHCAALTDLEYCQKHPQEAEIVNVSATKTIVDWCKRFHSQCVFISTGGIFDGHSHSGYSEDDLPHPLNVYAETKYKAETIVHDYMYSYIFRAGWMIGGGSAVDKKMLGKLMGQLQTDVVDVYGVNDMYGTLTYTEDLVTTIIAVLQSQRFGTYHVASPEIVSRHDIVKKVVSFLGKKVTVHSVPSSYFSSQFYVERPQYECLKSDTLKSLGLLRHRGVDDVLSEYLSVWQ